MKKITSALLISLALVACNRGESKTIEELVEISKERISESMTEAEMAGEEAIRDEVAKLQEDLTGLLQSAEAGDMVDSLGLNAVAEQINSLVPKAGATSRSSLTELSKQFQILGGDSKVQSDQVKVLVARTFHSLASEMESTKFLKK